MSKYKFEYYFVPTLLIIIAILQLVLVKTSHLSPWKGGGFGMFASIDSPNMRTVNAYGFDYNGTKVKIDIWSSVTPHNKKKLQCIPSSKMLMMIGKELIESEFVPVNVGLENAIKKISETKLYNQDDNNFSNSFKENNVVYRKKKRNNSSLKAIHFKTIVIEIWQLHYDKSSSKLYCTRIGEPINIEE